jgi:hypothetical protein
VHYASGNPSAEIAICTFTNGASSVATVFVGLGTVFGGITVAESTIYEITVAKVGITELRWPNLQFTKLRWPKTELRSYGG